MDKNAIKKYAVWARRELIERVSQRAMIYGITAKDAGDPNAESVNGHLLSQTEKRQRQALIRNIKTKGYEQVMEEVAYTWFNRFAALRFMEVNGYLPSHIRVFTNDAGEFKPQILAEAIHLELDGLDMNKVYELESANKSEELFKYLLIVQCNALNSILPGMFQRIEDYTELLLPDYLLREGSVIEQMVTTIPEEDWTDQVQIIGWLYQYYNTEPKDKVFADLKKNIKITKENIPAATQLFTPDWIVHYMVENSLGRLWLEGHPNDALQSEWKYYLDEAEQEPEVQAQLATIRKEYAALKPEEISVIDPCMGSGHILCVLFDVLVRIYEDYGYTAREAAVKIVENNLWGLDIDERAAQLSYFAVMMKARQYDRRFFTKKDENGNLAIPQPHVYAIQESNHLDSYALEYFCNNRAELNTSMQAIIKELHDAKEYGSILAITPQDWSVLYTRFDEVEQDISMHRDVALQQLKPLVQVAQTLAQKYHTVVTNPPYMSSAGMAEKLSKYTKRIYPNSKSDLYAVFIERCGSLSRLNGFYSMITQHSWMFLPSYEELRQNLLLSGLKNIVHLGTRAFEEISGEVVQTASFVFQKASVSGYTAKFVRLVDFPSQDEKEAQFFNGSNLLLANTDMFKEMPSHIFSYWASKNTFRAFTDYGTVSDFGDARQGMATGDNNKFVRFWYEPIFETIGFGYDSYDSFRESGKRYVPYTKSAGLCRWYGNYYNVLKFDEHNYELLSHSGNCLPSRQYYFRKNANWSLISTGHFGARFAEQGSVFDVGAHAFYGDNNVLKMLGYLNSVVFEHFIKFLSPTINYNSGIVAKVPALPIPKEVETIVEENIELAKKLWNMNEFSWEFLRHPLVGNFDKIEEAFEIHRRDVENYSHQIASNERKLNQIFINQYELTEELPIETDESDLYGTTDQKTIIRSLLSYAVGCMFGRYSLDVPGLVYAGGTWDASKYTTFQPDKDAIIPICDDEYFDDDIVGRFVKFIEVVYGKETLEENLKFIADALGGKGTSREVIRNYFMNDFYADHLKVYQKRPIYWLFDSGKKNGFKCLIYMHRYQPDTVARIRTDYVHEQQSRYRTAIADLEQRINGASTSERVKLSKQLTTLQAQTEEIRVYEEKIHHLADQMIKIDLDDGVKHNYEIFKDVLAKIK